MQMLNWEKKGSGRWLLKAANGQIWAAITKYKSEYACKNQYRGTVMVSGKGDWTTGIGVASAKRNVLNRIIRGHWTETFQIAEAL